MAGSPTPELDVELLLADVRGTDRLTLMTRFPDSLTERELERFYDHIRRREAMEPIAYIIGRKAFWTYEFLVSPATLIPRPDSEVLVALASQEASEAKTVLDLGTGSGALLLSVLGEIPGAVGVGVDISCEALLTARRNALRLGLQGRARFVESDWFAALDGARFDLILANPPYVTEAEYESLMPDVRLYEPRTALVAGPDGLDAYRSLLADLRQHLSPDGIALFEIGSSQAKAVQTLSQAAGFSSATVHLDFAGHDRVVMLKQ